MYRGPQGVIVIILIIIRIIGIIMTKMLIIVIN